VRTLLPSWEPGASAECTWAPVLAWALLRSLPGKQRPEQAFDQLQLREALGAMFSTSGLEGEDVWRAAARIRVLLAYGAQPVESVVYARKFWDDADVRWLAGVNVSGEKTYLNQEATDELVAWMMLPSLLKAAGKAEFEPELRKIEERLAKISADVKAAGFELERLLARPAGKPNRNGDKGSGGAAVAEELLRAEDAGAKAAPVKGSGGQR
jgi:hypothetical protein